VPARRPAAKDWSRSATSSISLRMLNAVFPPRFQRGDSRPLLTVS
jgi:hypothetical protein